MKQDIAKPVRKVIKKIRPSYIYARRGNKGLVRRSFFYREKS